MDSNSQSPTSGDPFIVPFSVSGSVERKLPEPCKELLERLTAPNGPTPHLILKTSEIAIQRLRKKIRRLTEQRDHWKSEYEKLSYILRLFPYSQAIKERQQREDLSEKLKTLANYNTMVPLLVSENERLKAENERLRKAIPTFPF